MLIFSIYDILFCHKDSIFKWLAILMVPIVGVYIYFEKVLRFGIISQMRINKLNPKPEITEQEIKATMLRRAGAAFTDYIIVTQFVYWFIMLNGQANGQGGKSVAGGDAFYILAFWFLYLPFAEFAFGRTLGKWIFGVKVVRGDGSKVNFISAMRRRSIDLVDLIVFLFIFVRVGSAVTIPRRLGDYWGHSWVVRSKSASVTA